jgi:hypothetical protein
MQRLSLYRALTLAALAIALCTFAVSGAFATALPITDTGILNLSGVPATAIGITSIPSCINFAGGATCAGATHATSVGSGSNLFLTGSAGTIKDIGTTFPIPQFETVSGAGALLGQTINFDLTSLHLNASTIGTCSGANVNNALNSCAPIGSPFTFAESASGTQVSLSFSALLNAYTGTAATGVTSYIAVFGTQLTGTLTGAGACSGLTANISNILSCQAAGGTITATWSASETPQPASSTPEPGSLVLMGSGLVGLAGVLRRRLAR